jgi:hypothetical protein
MPSMGHRKQYKSANMMSICSDDILTILINTSITSGGANPFSGHFEKKNQPLPSIIQLSYICDNDIG